MSGKPKDLTGMRSGRLEVLEIVGKNKKGRYVWKCKCDCGNYVEVCAKNLSSKGTRSCGCLTQELYQKMRTGEVNYKRSHGKSGTRLYSIWKDMKRRTININRQNYSRYGGRGIKVCKEWFDSFELFEKWSLENGYAENLEIDRIDNDKDYSPDNCRWVAKKVNMNNRSTSKKITYKGETKTVAEWASITGISYTTLMYRINRGWDIEKIFESK